MNFNEFFNELKRRNVFKGTISYLVFSWVLLQVVTILTPIVNAPAWVGKMILILLIVILPVWITVSWFFEVTTEGIRKTKNVPAERSIAKKTGRKFNAFIIVFLALAIMLLFVDRFRIKAKTDTVNDIAETFQPTNKSIAVLPFRDMSPTKNQEYFADGLAEELLNSLAKIPELQVTSRTSAFSFKNKAVEMPQIGKKLNVNYILEGSVRTYDSLIRVGVQLIEAKNDKNLWSQTWNKEITNIFKIQDEIAEAVVANLELRILDNVIPKVREAKTDSYQLYLKAKFEYSKPNGFEGVKVAQDLLKQSLDIDPSYAPAWVLLSKTHHMLNNFGVTDKTEGYPLAKNAALKALEIDSTYAPTYPILATIAIDFERDYDKAKQLIDKGLQIEPNNPDVLDTAAEVALLFNNYEEALQHHLKLAGLNPLDDSAFYALGSTYYFMDRFNEAEKALKKSVQLNPKNDLTHHLLSLCLLYQNKLDEALEIANKESSEAFRWHTLAMVYHRMNNVKESDHYLSLLIDNHHENYSFQIACTYGFFQDMDKAFYWLDKAIFYRDFGLMESHIDPALEACRKDERWPAFVARLGFLGEE